MKLSKEGGVTVSMITERKLAVISAFWYTGLSAALALGFFLATGGGRYDMIARFGGAIWVFILAMIITMPAIIPFVKKKYS